MNGVRIGIHFNLELLNVSKSMESYEHDPEEAAAAQTMGQDLPVSHKTEKLTRKTYCIP